MITAQDYFIHPQIQPTGLGGYTLPAVFEAAVKARGDDPAIFDGERFRSWREWDHDAAALGRALQELGVSKGDVVAVHLPNSWEYLTVHIAIAAIGAVMFPVHMAYGEHELRVIVERAGAAALVIAASYANRDLVEIGKRILAENPTLKHLIIAGTEKQSGVDSLDDLRNGWAGKRPHPVTVRPEDPFVLLPSSGTTSMRPKICMHSHDGLVSNAAMVALEAQARAEDTLISASPFTHLFGLLAIHLSLFSTGRQALLPGWKTENFLKLVEKSNANVAFLVPAHMRDVCHYLDSHPETPHLRLREIRTGGAGVPSQLVADARRMLGARLIVQWGMSELGAGTFTRPDDPPEAASTSIGRPTGGSEARIIGETGEELGVDEVGELQYRGPNMFRGYLGDAEITRQALTGDGWLKTGDLASRNPDGTIAYQGRRTEFINRGGLKFSAVEVESLLVDLPALNQFAIVARNDERLGQRSCLVVSIRPGYTVTLENIAQHLDAKGLAKYKWPEELILVDEIPSTPTGKIARARLADLILAKIENQL